MELSSRQHSKALVSEAHPLVAAASLLCPCRPRVVGSWTGSWTAQVFDFVQEIPIRPARPPQSSACAHAHARARARAQAGTHARATRKRGRAGRIQKNINRSSTYAVHDNVQEVV